MDDSQYRAHPAVSYSGMKELAKSPAHFRYNQLHPVAENEAMLRGIIIHEMCLEPAEVPNRFIKGPTGNRTLKAVKEAWKEAEEKAQQDGLRIIPPAMWETAERCSESLESDVESSLWLDDARRGIIERPIFWKRQGIELKGKPDSVLLDGTVVDIKTTANCFPPVFEAEIFRRNYHCQGAFYRSGVQSLGERWSSHVLICVETEPPYAVAVFRLNEGVIDNADKVVTGWIDLYKQCLEFKRWPGYGLREVRTPAWAAQQAD